MKRIVFSFVILLFFAALFIVVVFTLPPYATAER